MAILKDKKVVIVGDRDGVPGPAIAACVETAGGEVRCIKCLNLYRVFGVLPLRYKLFKKGEKRWLF